MDEIRISAGTASGMRVVAAHPVHIVSSGPPAAAMAAPAWVADLLSLVVIGVLLAARKLSGAE